MPKGNALFTTNVAVEKRCQWVNIGMTPFSHPSARNTCGLRPSYCKSFPLRPARFAFPTKGWRFQTPAA
jgi:hypothetical protein